MKVLYVSNYVDKKYFNDIFNIADEKPIQSIQKFNQLFTSGLIDQKNIEEIDVISSAPVNRNISKKYFWKGKNYREDKISFSYIPFINIKFVKQICLFLFAIFILLFWCIRNIGKEKVLIFDGFYPIISTLSVLFCSFFGVMVVGLYTDVPKCMNHNIKNENKLHQITKFVVNIGDYINCKLSDAFILLTEQMNEVVNKNGKPYIVMEGMADINSLNDLKNLRKKNAIMYAGGLYETYGVKSLIDAFIKWNNKDYELWLCGDGDLVNYINSCNNKRIKYFGSLPNEKVVEMEREALLLVNPRFTSAEYTKYSFPSKIMEYMSSGTPVLTTKLAGIPKEYDKNLYYILDESVEGITKDLNKLLGKKDKSQLLKFGEKAKNFVLEKKSNMEQMKRVSNFIKKVLSKRKTKDYMLLLEKVSLIAITITSILPNFSNRYVFGLAIIVWIISIIPVLIKSKFKLFTNNKLFFISAIMIVLLMITNFLFNRYNLLFDYIFANVRIFSIMFIGLFYINYDENKENISRSFFVVVILIMLYACIKTGIYNTIHYNISRILSTGVTKDNYPFVGIVGLGSYYFIYGIVYLIFVFLVYVEKKIKNKQFTFNFYIVLLTLIFALFCLIKAEFVYSYILLAIALVMYIFKIYSIKKFIISVFVVLLIIFIFRIPLSNFMNYCADFVHKPNIEMRMRDVAHLLKGDVDKSIDVKERFEKYSVSINTFISNPVIGVGYNKGDDRIGSHSSVLDYFAKFGIIGGSILVMFITSSLNSIYRSLKSSCGNVFFCCSTVFVIFLLINNALFITIFYFLYVIIPLFLHYLEVENENIMDC